MATGLIKQEIASVLMKKGLGGVNSTSRLSAWCLGSLVCSDALAEMLTIQGLAQASADHLRTCSESPYSTPDDICAAVYTVARMARTIKISKTLAKAGCVKLLAHHLNTSVDPQVLLWTARAVGCLMRPNSSDMSKALLDAGTAKGLARLPRVLPTEEVEPLESFAFAIQRFSCAEWGGGTRKALVEAGVVDSLLAALRTAADVPYPHVHIELALAVSFLGDVGGSAIRKEIISAGGIDILKKVGASGRPEVAKACNMAVTSITGNLWTRNAGAFVLCFLSIRVLMLADFFCHSICQDSDGSQLDRRMSRLPTCVSPDPTYYRRLTCSNFFLPSPTAVQTLLYVLVTEFETGDCLIK